MSGARGETRLQLFVRRQAHPATHGPLSPPSPLCVESDVGLVGGVPVSGHCFDAFVVPGLLDKRLFTKTYPEITSCGFYPWTSGQNKRSSDHSPWWRVGGSV